MDPREEIIEDLVQSFNFEKVHIAMVALDWKWKPMNGEWGVPSIARLRDMARYLLKQSIKSSAKTSSSGGLEASYHPKVDDEDEYFELKFILTEKSSDDEY